MIVASPTPCCWASTVNAHHQMPSGRHHAYSGLGKTGLLMTWELTEIATCSSPFALTRDTCLLWLPVFHVHHLSIRYFWSCPS